MDRGTLLLVALAMLCVAGIVLGVAGISLFRRDRHAGETTEGMTGAPVEPAEPADVAKEPLEEGS